MTIGIGWWTIDVEDAERLSTFYTALLGWERLFDSEEGIALVPSLPPTLGQGFLLYSDHTTGPKRVKNRAHLDLRPADQAAAVAKALSLGATRADIGQGEPSWEVLRDPEGNEFCILRADGSVEDGIVVDAWALDANDIERVAAFWAALLGYEEVGRDGDDDIRLRDPSGAADDLLIIWTPDAKDGKNRVHPDLTPAGDPDDESAREREVARAQELGATRVDIGQGDALWAVMADPEGNEFCILKPGQGG